MYQINSSRIKQTAKQHIQLHSILLETIIFYEINCFVFCFAKTQKVNQKSTPDRPSCDCYEGTTFAAHFIKRPEHVMEDLNLDNQLRISDIIQVNYFIFSNMLLVFFLFCLGSIYWIRKRLIITQQVKNNILYTVLDIFYLFQKEIVFLSNNSLRHRYAYLVIIKTGKFRSSGTTSKIFIKLYGTRTKTEAYVLNSTDTNKRLFQRDSEDWFVLATPQHLGYLTEVKLWFNSNGCRPSW